MDYEKMYKDALERMKYWMDENTPDEFFDNHEVHTFVFPELAESEDERIRKALIQFFKEKDEEDFEEWVPKAKVLAWLERQGKNKVCISEATKQKLEDNLNKALEKETPESWNEFLEKQGEQKSVNDLTPQEAMDIAVAKCFEQGEQKPTDDIERKYNPCYNMSFEEAQEYISNRGFDIPWTDCDVFVDFKYVTQTVGNVLKWADDNPKQKPAAWSEEDGLRMENILSVIEGHGYPMEVEWLESIKGRVGCEVNCTTTRKWSEEDEKVLCKCLGALGNPNYCYEDGDLEHMRNWLHSLRPQSTWKPTKEQITAIRWVLNHIPYDSHKEEISGLLDQIKDL